MIQIQINFIPAKSTSDPWEVASATLDGIAYTERSRSSAIAKLARTLVAAGVPDQPWSAVSPNGTGALRGRSLHGIAGTTITEGDKSGLRRRPSYAPVQVAATPKNGSEAAAPEDDTGEDQKAAQSQTCRAQMGV